jgi:hypothetical protein
MNEKRLNKFKIFMLLCLTILIIQSNSVVAFTHEINIALPKFDVTINGVKIENQYRKYPFIVYKDITYFPMTYVDSRFLGLETKWDNSTGLKIINTEQVGSYGDFEPDLQTGKNLDKYRADIPTFNIKLNEKTIDNSKETYPLIIFRNITYFPLIWRFAVDEFGWNYSFSSEYGLKVDSFTPPPKNLVYPIITEKIFDGKLKVQISHSRMPLPGNLYISKNGEELKQTGNVNLIYGVVGSKGIGDSGLSLQSNDYMELKDDWIYINAIEYSKDGASGIYKVNIETGETIIVE